MNRELGATSLYCKKSGIILRSYPLEMGGAERSCLKRMYYLAALPGEAA